VLDKHLLPALGDDDDNEEVHRVAREAMLRPLFEEPLDIERESAWDGPKGFLIGGMMRGTIQETAHQYINAANVIINAIKHDEIEDFRLAHPALFLYRHAVELMLKAVLPNAGKVHRLDKLADRFKDFVKAEFGEDVPGWLMDRLRELAHRTLPPSGMLTKASVATSCTWTSLICKGRWLFSGMCSIVFMRSRLPGSHAVLYCSGGTIRISCRRQCSDDRGR
jgi:HEPN domain-containing protein